MTKELHEDPWIQVFALLAILSGGLTLHGLSQRILGQVNPPRGPAPGPYAGTPRQNSGSPAGAADEDSRMQILAPDGRPAGVGTSSPGQPSLEDVLLGRAPAGAAAPSAPSLGGSGVQKTISSKTPGKWIVDISKAADADTDDLALALASVAAGDSVSVRPGVYKGTFIIDKAVTVSGTGPTADAVVLQGSQAQTVSLAGAAATLRNLSVRHEGLKASRAVFNQKGTLTLDHVVIHAAPGALGVESRGGIVSAAELRIPSSYVGVGGSDGATIKLDRVEITAPEAVGVALARGGTLELTASTIKGSGGHGILLFEGAEARVTKTAVVESKNCALSIQNATARLDGVHFNRNDCGVIFPAGGTLESDRGDFASNEKGPLSYQEAFLALIDVKGTSNRPPLELGALAGFDQQSPGAAPGARRRTNFGRFDIFDSDPLKKKTRRQ